MGKTVVSPTIASTTVGNDDETSGAYPVSGTVAFNSMGTSPILNSQSGSLGGIRLKITSGSGSPAIAANNIVITLANTNRTPRKVFIGADVLAPGWHVASVGAGTITIGTKVAPAASTAYDIEVVVAF